MAHEKEGFVLRYSEFSAAHDIPQVSIRKCNCGDAEEYISQNMTGKNTAFQKIGDTIIVVNGSTSGMHHNQTFFRDFDVGFVRNDYQFLFVGKNLDELKHDLVSNYFPEHSTDDFVGYSDGL